MQINQYIGLRFVIHIYGGSDVRSNITRPSIYSSLQLDLLLQVLNMDVIKLHLMQAIQYKGLQ